MDVESTADSLRDSLSAAFDSVGTGEGQDLPPPIIAPEQAEPAQPTTPPKDQPVPEGPGPETPEPGERHPAKPGERQRDAHGRFQPKDGNATEPPRPAEQSATPAPPQAQPTPTEVRAPPAWKATAREKWANTPPEVQAEVTRREREISLALDQTAEARRFHAQFRDTLGPYEGLLRAEGLDPLKGAALAVQTLASLRTAPVPHRAQVLADLIQQSGVPLETLDTTLQARLTGQAPSSTAPGVTPAYQDPRVDQLLAQLQQAAQQRQAAVQQKSAQEVTKFGEGREWFEDVRDTMADLLEVAAKRGVEMSLEEAYNAAIASPLHKDIAEVVRQREAARRSGNAQASTQRAKQAASSVRSQPAGAARNGAPQRELAPFEDRKADLEAAFAELDGR